MDPQTTFSLAKYLDFAKEASFSSWNNIRHIREHDSTQDYCKKAIKEGEGKGLLVVCDKQLHGRGRSGNHWLSASGESLTFSVVLDKISSYPDYLPLLLGLACLKAVLLKK